MKRLDSNANLDSEILIRLPSSLKFQLKKIAKQLDQTEGEIVRRAIAHFVYLLDDGLVTAEPPADIKEAVQNAVAASANWKECERRLADVNLTFIARGGGLAIMDRSSGEILCKASQAGFGYAALMRKFREPFPNHPATWLEEKILGR